jgi:hypothetical protein
MRNGLVLLLLAMIGCSEGHVRSEDAFEGLDAGAEPDALGGEGDA